MSVKFSLPQLGHWMWCSLIKSIIFSLDQPSALSPVKSSMSLSARWRVLQSLQSIRGSEKPPTWPVATHTWGFIRDGGVHAHVGGGLLDKLFPPGLFHVIFKLHAQRAVIPGVGQAAVDLAAGEDKPPGFAQADDGIHGFFSSFHKMVRLSAFSHTGDYCSMGGKGLQRKREILKKCPARERAFSFFHFSAIIS